MLLMLNNRLAKKVFQAGEYLQGEYISEKLNELKKNELMSEGQLQEMRIAKLNRLLEHATSYSPYYEKRLSDINLSQIQSFDDLIRIEPISKEELRANVQKIRSINPISKMAKAKTSGSTGIPLVFPKDSISRAYHYAAMYRGHSWYGLKIGDREARLWGVPVDLKTKIRIKTVDLFLNRFREKDYNLTEEILHDFLYKITKFWPKYIMGYGKMIYEFGLYLKQHNRNLEHLQLKMVKYTTENINEVEKGMIEEVYCCPVVSEYGAAETGIISFQCPKGNHHIMSDCIHVEYLDVDGQNMNLKEILITDLNNLSFPIIRYRLGDLVVPKHGLCGCGLPFPMLEKVQGRTSEIFSIDGNIKYHSIIFYYIMKGLPGDDKKLLQFRVLQKSPNTFCYQLACKGKNEQIEKYIAHRTKQELGSNIEIQIEYLEKLPRDPSGKLRDFIPFDQG